MITKIRGFLDFLESLAQASNRSFKDSEVFKYKKYIESYKSDSLTALQIEVAAKVLKIDFMKSIILQDLKDIKLNEKNYLDLQRVKNMKAKNFLFSSDSVLNEEIFDEFFNKPDVLKVDEAENANNTTIMQYIENILSSPAAQEFSAILMPSDLIAEQSYANSSVDNM